MNRHQDHRLGVPHQAGHRAGGLLTGHGQQGVNHRIARDRNGAQCISGLEIVGCPGCGGKVELGQLADQAAIGFLRVGIP